jgi:hypothetical protein
VDTEISITVQQQGACHAAGSLLFRFDPILPYQWFLVIIRAVNIIESEVSPYEKNARDPAAGIGA